MQHYHLISSDLVSSPAYLHPHAPLSLSLSLSSPFLSLVVCSFAASPCFPFLSLFSALWIFSFSISARRSLSGPFLFSARYLIPRLRNVHSILSHLLEVTRDLSTPSFHFPPGPSFISNSVNAPTDPHCGLDGAAYFCPAETFATFRKCNT